MSDQEGIVLGYVFNRSKVSAVTFFVYMDPAYIFQNRPFATKPSRDLLFIKLWAIA